MGFEVGAGQFAHGAGGVGVAWRVVGGSHAGECFGAVEVGQA